MGSCICSWEAFWFGGPTFACELWIPTSKKKSFCWGKETKRTCLHWWQWHQKLFYQTSWRHWKFNVVLHQGQDHINSEQAFNITVSWAVYLGFSLQNVTFKLFLDDIKILKELIFWLKKNLDGIIDALVQSFSYHLLTYSTYFLLPPGLFVVWLW